MAFTKRFIKSVSPISAMEPENTLIEERLRKLKEIRDTGVNPYPYSYDRTHHAADILEKFDKKLKKEQKSKTKVSVAGRIMALRRMGKASFMHLQDETGKIQLYFRQDDVGEVLNCAVHVRVARVPAPLGEVDPSPELDRLIDGSITDLELKGCGVIFLAAFNP